MKRYGKGTGTIRRQRMDELTRDWNDCQHYCYSSYEVWTHKIHNSMACHLPIFQMCLECLEFPLEYDGKRVVLK